MKRELGIIDNDLYILGWVALSAVVAAVLLYEVTGISVLRLPFICIFKKVTGLWCPGCGGVRSVRALFRGEIWQSFIDFPPTIYGIVVYTVFMVRCFIIKHVGSRKAPKKDGVLLPYIFIGLIIMLIQWIVKLVALIGFGYSWIR